MLINILRNRYLTSMVCPFILLFNMLGIIAQDSITPEPNATFESTGYVSTVQSAYFTDIENEWTTEDILHNRLQLKYTIKNKIFAEMHLRNRFIYGNRVTLDPEYALMLSGDKGFIDLSGNWVHGNSYILNTQIDRLHFSVKSDKYSFTMGRQRINWGQTFVWNPLDIFNTYSFFDIDYPERPGSDAIRFEYFQNPVSGFELAVKSDSSGTISGAFLLRFNKWLYDFQVMLGCYETDNLVFGGGWSGSIGKLGFYGESSFIHDFKYKRYFFNSSVAFNYISSNSVTVLTEFLFSQTTSGHVYKSFTDVLNRPLSTKNLAFSKYSVFIQAGYPINPLININIAAMFLPSINAYYLGPNISFSVSNNLEVFFASQYFRAKFPIENNLISAIQTFTMGLLHLKFSF